MGNGVDSASNSEKAESMFEYYRIPANMYQADELVCHDLYLLYQGQYILYRPKNLLWKKEDSERLREFQVKDLYIQCSSSSEHHTFLESNLSKILDEPSIDQAQKTQVIYDTSQALISDIFEKPQSSENVRRSVSFVRNSVDFLKDKSNFYELMKLASTNFNEYTHALQVSAYAISLAREVGMKSFNELSAIGVASILHDIGKTKIDRKILDKKSALDENERREVEKHPELGYEILRRQRTIPENAELIVLQHHENPNGTGYPYRLGSDTITSARIVAIADCFDVLTSDRPWSVRMKPAEAIQFMRQDLASQYDSNLLLKFIGVLGVTK